jgi:cytochrome P450
MATIPTPSTPEFLQLANWIFRPLDYMETGQRKFGDLFRARGSLFDWVFVSHPDDLKYMLTHDTKEFSAPGDVNLILKPLLGEHSVIMLSGHEHQNRRKLIMPPFHGERLKVYGELIRNLTRETMAELTPGSAFKARDITQKISMRVILQAVFGLHAGERYEKLDQLLKTRLDMAGSPLASTLIFIPILRTDLGPWSPGGKINAFQQEIDDLLFAEIRERRANPAPERTDILSLMLLARDEEGNGMTDQELRDELMTLLVAGHETTATAMAWALYWTHRHPEIKATLLQEIEDQADADPVSLTRLPYLNAVCCETLRIYPVGMLTFARRVEQPVKLRDYALEPGEIVVGSIYLLHHREDLYPSPNEYRPERFLERQYSAFEFMPFGAGMRRCVGAALAMYEMKIVLGTLLPEFDLALADNAPLVPERRGITLGMKGGVGMVYQGKRDVKAKGMAAP